MNFCHREIAWSMIATFVCFLAAPAWAQEPKPEASKVEKPSAKQPPAEEALAPENPAVTAILATKPATPAECVRAAKTLTDLGHPEAAKPLLKKVLDAKLDPRQLADLGEQFGSPMFLDLAGRAELLPEAKQLADAVLPAVTAKLEDVKRIAELIGQLQDPQAEKRMQALAGLQAAGRAAIGPLIAVLADQARTAEHENVRTVLAGMGRTAREPLAAILDGADPKLAVQAILTLAEMNNPKVALYLVWSCVSEKSDPEVRAAAAAALKQLTGRVPTQPEAVQMLNDAAKAYLARRQPIEDVDAVDGKVALWRWNQAKRQCVVVRRCTPEDASRGLAARWARGAHFLAPDDHECSLLYVAAELDAVGYDGNLDIPFFDKALSSTKALNEVLGYTLTHGYARAATQVAWMLSNGGKADELLYQGDKPAPLVQAVQSPDRRLRMAALEAIVKLRPTKPFAGSSYVPAALSFFAASSGVRHALVAGPNIEQARDLAGMLAAAGFETDTATTGKELLRLATRSPDYELAWIDVSINHPEIGALLQELRRDWRTASLRVGLVARSGYSEQAERVARLDPMAKTFARPHDEQAFHWQLEQLATLRPQEFVDFDARQRQAAESLDLLAELSQSSGKLYDLQRVQDSVLAALYNPKLAVRATTVLANLNSAESQRALVEVASRFTLPLELRQAAAKAFRQNTEKHGILLTTEEIRKQYQRYNESEKQDAATQRVLGLILDCIEAAGAQR